MTNLTKEEYARLHLKAKRGMLTAEERAALEAYEAAAQPAPQTPVPADTETLLCCPYCGHATITTQIVSDVTYRKPATVIAMMFAPLIAVVLAFLLRNMFVTVPSTERRSYGTITPPPRAVCTRPFSRRPTKSRRILSPI